MNELRFTASIRRALDESAARLPARVTQRLEAARAAALAQVPESVEAGSASRLAESSLAAARLPGARLRESRHPQAGLPETLTHPGSRPGSLSRSGGASRPRSKPSMPRSMITIDIPRCFSFGSVLSAVMIRSALMPLVMKVFEPSTT